MPNDIKDNIKQPSIWMRGLYMLLFAIFYSIAELVLFAVVVFQFILKLVTGETNERLLVLGQSFATYMYQIIQFLNFNSERKPYPFDLWPKGDPAANQPPADASAPTTGEQADAEPAVADGDGDNKVELK